MRYFIFILVILCNSCTLFNPRSLVKESKSTPKETVVAATKSAVDSPAATNAIAEESAYTSAVNVNLSTAYALSFGEYSSLPYGCCITSYNFGQLYTVTLTVPIKIDSIPLQSVDSSVDTNSVAPIKVIFPKSSATILPETKSSITRYIIPGIATAFLIAFFFFVTKRRKKNIVQH